MMKKNLPKLQWGHQKVVIDTYEKKPGTSPPSFFYPLAIPLLSMTADGHKGLGFLFFFFQVNPDGDILCN